MAVTKNIRPHIGVLISSLEESCQSKLWKGIEKRARELNIDLTVYLSTFQQKDGKLEEHYSVVFDDILSNNTLDGLILFSGFIAEDITTEAVEEFVRKCGDLPMVSLAMSFPSIPSLLVDNRTGINEIVSHLIEEHSFNKIAFVKGPEDHEEAQARYAGYCDALDNSNIPLNSSLVLPGHFSDWSGEEAVEILLDQRKENVQAIVCADDETAIGVIKELSRRNILVPEDIAVCGFDDEEYAKIITPSLTTARQPFYELGRESLTHLLNQLKGKPCASLELLQTESIIRQSCGCVAKRNTIPYKKLKGTTTEEKMFSYSKEIFPKAIEKEILNEWTTKITSHFTDTLDINSFLHTIDCVLISSRNLIPDISVWTRYLTELLTALHESGDSPLQLPEYSQAILQGIQLVHDAINRNYQYNVLQQNESQWEIRGIAQELVTSFNLRELTEKLRKGANELNIDTAMIFLYNEPCLYSQWLRPDYVTYILGFHKDKLIRPDLRQLLIPINEICDFITFEQEKNRTSLFYMPLFFGEEQIGVMLMEYNPESPLEMYETIRINVATALKGAYLFEQIEHQSITDEMTQLYNRRGFITFSLSRIAHLRRSNVHSMLFFIDMDGLKMINDTYGHKAGDTAIKTCSNIIKESLREEDIIGRMGGDEFTVLASDVNKKQTSDIINRLRAAFVLYNKESGLPYEVNCSIGVHALKDYSEEAFELALQQADELLYKEKREKRTKGISRS